MTVNDAQISQSEYELFLKQIKFIEVDIAESTIIKLLAHYHAIKENHPLDTTLNPIDTITLLETQLRDQELFLQAKDAYTTCKAAISQSSEIEQVIVHLRTLFTVISPLNVFKVNEYISRSQSKIDLLQPVTRNGKQEIEIVLFYGPTAVGKSTTMQYSGGTTFVRREVQNGLIHYEPVSYMFEAFKTVKTNPLMKSETRYLNPVTFNANAVLGKRATRLLTLCDAAGNNHLICFWS